MASFTAQAHITTGEKTIISVDAEKAMRIAVDAPTTAEYTIEYQLDGSGIRHPLKADSGSTSMTTIGIDGVGVNVTALPSGTLTFEVLSSLKIVV